MMNHVKRWMGVTPRPPQAVSEQPSDMANQIWRVHQAVDAVYGPGFARRNPHIVAQFMQAFAAQAHADAVRDQAAEIATLREIFASGEGGLTIGVEKS